MDAQENPWSEPGFLLQPLVRLITCTRLHWGPTLGNLRLVSKSWCHGVGQAVEVLAPRPAVATSDLVQLPRSFPNLKVLAIDTPTADGPNMDELLVALGRGLSGMRALQAFPLFITAHGAAELGRFPALTCLELWVPGAACVAAAIQALGSSESLSKSLRRLRLLPVADWAGGASGGTPELAASTFAWVTLLTGLHHLACSARCASSAHLASLSVLTQLSSLELSNLASSLAPALADLVPALSHLHFDLDFSPPLDPGVGAGGYMGDELSTALPLSCLSRLSSLSAPWELFCNPAHLSWLGALTSLSVDFHAEVDTLWDDRGVDRSACCVLLLRRMSPSLRHLRLGGGGSEVPASSLEKLSRLAPSLTSLTLDRMFNADNEVLAAVGRLGALRMLHLRGTSFDGDGVGALRALVGGLTRLELDNSAGVMSSGDLAEALAQVSGLRHLRLRGHPYMSRAALEGLLSSLPSLELLQTTWKPQGDGGRGGRGADAAFCAQWRHVLQHSMGMAGGRRGVGSELDAGEALHQAGVI